DRTGHAVADGELAAVERTLAAAVAETRARWPEVGDRDADFVEAIAPRIEGEPALADAVARLSLPDVYLVAACLAGGRGGVAACERPVRAEPTRAVARVGTHAPAAEDVVQELLVKLVVGDHPKLAAFGGHGALHAWLRVAAVRTAISMTRRRREVAASD